MDGGEVLRRDLDAHLDAQVVDVVDVPGAGVADDLAVRGLRRTASAPRRSCGSGAKPSEVKKPSPYPDHLDARRSCGDFRISRQVVAGVGALRRDERVDVVPVLRPHVAEQVRGDRPVRRDRVAVLLAQLRAHVGVQRDVERLHLLPQPVELGRELLGRHVVLRAPHRARVGEAELSRALVGELDEAGVARLDRRRDRVPAGPDVQQLLRVPRRGHDLRDVLEVEALALGRAVLALAVHALHRRAEARQLRRLGRIVGRGHGQRELQEPELARRLRVDLHAVEAGGLLGVPHARGDGLLVGLRREDLGVVGDVGRLDPVGATRVDPELQQVLLGRLDELLRLVGGRGPGPGRSRLAGHVSGHGQPQERHASGRQAGDPSHHSVPPHLGSLATRRGNLQQRACRGRDSNDPVPATTRSARSR